MDQISNTELKEFFSGLVADPVAVDTEHAPQLRTLVDLYPQSGLLRALLARAIQVDDQSDFQKKLKSAAVYAPDRAVLYNLINYPEKLVKYVEPLPEMFEEEGYYEYYEEDPNAYYEETDQQGYNYTEGAVYEEAPVNNFGEGIVYEETPVNNYTETPVYEEPVNYFHDPEESLQPEEILRAEDNYGPFNTVVPQQEQEEVQETISYYHQNTELEAPVEPAADHNYTAPENYIAPGPDATVEPVADHNYNYTEPLAETPQTYYDPQAYTEQPAAYYDPAAYTEPVAEQQPEPYMYDNSNYIVEEPQADLPPIPGYHKPNFEQEIVNASADAASEIDDEVYDEITGIEDIHIDPITLPRQDYPTASLGDSFSKAEATLMTQYGTEAPIVTEAPADTHIPPAEPAADTRGHDFSVNNFRDKLRGTEQEAEYVEPESDEIEFEMVVDEPAKPEGKTIPAPVKVEPQFAYDDGRVSKYNDDKMPYSFMWWLDKTRKEHATNHQPYAPFEPIAQEIKKPAETDELQQQYFENIFHLTSVEQLDRHTRSKRKEVEIIDRFIQQDPQLKAPNTDKLDNENKAKKSSEDDDQFVSETLARIYLDQMLYPKAISTYQKLLLKFPEKSSYFVAQIKLLEKKIN